MVTLCPFFNLPPNPSLSSTPMESRVPVAPPAASTARCRIYRPAENSLYDLFYQHSGTSLFVRPIRWTDQHAQLLGTRWEQLRPCDSPKPDTSPGQPPSNGHLRPSHTTVTLINSLNCIFSSDTRQSPHVEAVEMVLKTLWPRPFDKPCYKQRLHLYFGGRVYRDAIFVEIMWNFPSDESNSSYSSFRSVSTRPADSFNLPTSPSTASQGPTNVPMVCYIGKNQLAEMRSNTFRIWPSPGGSENEPVKRLTQRMVRLLAPSNSDQDAYFVGIFLAMAQRYFYPAPARRKSRRKSQRGELMTPKPKPNFRDVTLRILTHETDIYNFIVYTAYVTKEILEKFHNPFKATQGEEKTELSGIKIEFTRVPIWPVLGLRERLGNALGHDVVGEFNDKEMETWEKDPEKHEGGKRKREVSEVLGNSSDGDSGDGPLFGAKKCCLTKRIR